MQSIISVTATPRQSRIIKHNKETQLKKMLTKKNNENGEVAERSKKLTKMEDGYQHESII